MVVAARTSSHHHNSYISRLLTMGQEGRLLRCLTKSARGTLPTTCSDSNVPLLQRQQTGRSSESPPPRQHRCRHLAAEEVAAVEAAGGRVDRPA